MGPDKGQGEDLLRAGSRKQSSGCTAWLRRLEGITLSLTTKLGDKGEESELDPKDPDLVLGSQRQHHKACL
jgi:hypothetical protein